jgi:hypothetical protein
MICDFNSGCLFNYGVAGLALMDSIRAIGSIEDIEALKGLIRNAESLDRVREFVSGLGR